MKRAYSSISLFVGFCSLTCLLLFSYGLYAEESVLTNNGNSCPRKKPTNARKHFEICTIKVKYHKSVLLLDAQIFYGFSKTALRALESGVPITVQLTIEFYRARDWVWDESIANLSQRFTLQYHTLTHKYVITNINSKAKQIFSTRAEAMDALSQVKQLPVLDKKFIRSSSRHYARARARLLISHLPSALRLWAYMSSDWRLKSEWYQWPL